MLVGVYSSSKEPFASMSPREFEEISGPSQVALYSLCLTIWEPIASWYWSKFIKANSHPNDEDPRRVDSEPSSSPRTRGRSRRHGLTSSPSLKHLATPDGVLKVERWLSRATQSPTSHPNDNDGDAECSDDDRSTADGGTLNPADSISRTAAKTFPVPEVASAGNQTRNSYASNPRMFGGSRTETASSSPTVATACAGPVANVARAETSMSASGSMCQPDIREVLDEWAKVGYIEKKWRERVRFDPKPGRTDEESMRLWRFYLVECMNGTLIPNLPFQLYGTPEYYQFDLIACWVEFKMPLKCYERRPQPRYRGLHVITQGQLERIYVRDLLRHQVLVETQLSIGDFEVKPNRSPSSHPVVIKSRNEKKGIEETVRSKFLVGSDGGSSTVRKEMKIPFNGVSTDIYQGILYCKFGSNNPHAWVFGSVIFSKHGGCVIFPRENGHIRLYTQLDTSTTGTIAQSRQAKNRAEFQESGGHVDAYSGTADEILEQAYKIFAPYELKFAAPLSWLTVWKISERVARWFSSQDCGVHLAGDAAYIHFVMSAFGINASITDSVNLAWKIGMCAQNHAKLSTVGPTYGSERRYHANRIIHVSGSYLRFVCNSTFPLVEINHVNKEWPPLPEPQKYQLAAGKA
ncbi:MAG: hypothetical protein Q9188_005009 [Gyalolechia gomerana]